MSSSVVDSLSLTVAVIFILFCRVSSISSLIIVCELIETGLEL